MDMKKLNITGKKFLSRFLNNFNDLLLSLKL